MTRLLAISTVLCLAAPAAFAQGSTPLWSITTTPSLFAATPTTGPFTFTTCASTNVDTTNVVISVPVPTSPAGIAHDTTTLEQSVGGAPFAAVQPPFPARYSRASLAAGTQLCIRFNLSLYSPPENTVFTLVTTVTSTQSPEVQSSTGFALIASSTNNAPTITRPTAQATTAEDTPLVFSSVNANAIRVADPDVGPGTLRFELSVASGHLTLGTTSGLSFLSGDGTRDASMSLSGTLANINNALSSVTYEPPANFSGAVSLFLTANDLGNSGAGGARSASAVVPIQVTAIDDPPVFTSGNTATVPEKQVEVLALSASDVESDPRTFTLLPGQDGPAFDLTADGVLRFAQPPDFEAPADVDADNVYVATVRVTANGRSVDQSVTVTVTNVDEGPVFTSSGDAGVPENTTTVLRVAATDPEGETVQYTIGGGPDASRFTIDPATGVLAFVTTPDFEKPHDADLDNAYRVSVQARTQASTTTQPVTVAVANVDEAPTFTSSASVQVVEGSTAVLTLTASDPENDPLHFRITGGADAAGFTLDGTGGALAFVVSPVFAAPTDTGADRLYEVEVSVTANGRTTTQRLAVRVVSGVNAPPVNRVPATVTTTEDTPLLLALANGAPISIADPDVGTRNVAVTLGATHATLTLAETTRLLFSVGDGSSDARMTFTATLADANAALATLSFTPDTDFSGAATLDLTASDLGHTGSGGAGVDHDVIDVSITPVNDPPVATCALPAIDEGSSANVLDAGRVVVTDPDDLPATLGLRLTQLPAAGTLRTGTVASTLTEEIPLDALVSGSFLYDHDGGEGPADSFTFVPRDAAGAEGPEVTCALTLLPVNDAPLAADDTGTLDEDTSLELDVLANDTDGEGEGLVATIEGEPAHGTVALSTDHRATYTPRPDFEGTDRFTYRVSDPFGGSAVGEVRLTVVGVNDAPVAVDDVFETDEDTALAFDPRTNDLDVDDTTLTLGELPTLAHGTLERLPDGGLRFTPEPDFHGETGFRYTLSDAFGLSATAEVTLVVRAVDDAPVALAARVELVEDSSVALTVTGVDVEAAPLGFTITTPPAHGTLEGTAPELHYIPDRDFFGEDGFAFTVNDGTRASEPGQVTLVVAAVDDAPVWWPDTAAEGTEFAVIEGTAFSVTVLALDVDGDTVTYSFAGLPEGATTSGGTITWTPTTEDAGTHPFRARATDGRTEITRNFVAIVRFVDADEDGIADDVEVALGLSPTTGDTDGDGLADLDELGDPTAPRNTDGDALIDALDTDSDGDGLSDASEAGDSDGDGAPDARDTDSDDDTRADGVDNCVRIANTDQLDRDGDGLGDACEDDTAPGPDPETPVTGCGCHGAGSLLVWPALLGLAGRRRAPRLRRGSATTSASPAPAS